MDLKATALLKLIYLEMFGHDMSWASFHVLEVMSCPKYLQKRVGYLAAVQSFRPDTEVLMLATNLLKKDVSSPLVPTISLPLVTLPHIITSSLALSLLTDLLPRLSHSNPNIRKKTVAALYRLALVHPDTLRSAWPKIKDLLMDEDEDSSVTAAVVNVVCELGWRRPRDFLALAPRLFDLLVDGGNNWMAIKIIKLFATLTPLEPRLIKKLLPPLTNLIRTTPAMSLLYECINGVIQGGILEGTDGVGEGEEIASLCVGKLRGMIVVEGDPNLKYVALLAFNRIVSSHPHLISMQQDVIMSCIDDPDVSIRLQALDLGAGMVNINNMVDVVERLMQQLHSAPTATRSVDHGRSHAAGVEPAADSEGEDPEETLRPTADPQDETTALPAEYKSTIIHRILDMCSKDSYSNITDFEWYIDILIRLVKLVPPSGRSRPELYESSGNSLRNSHPPKEADPFNAIGWELRNVAVRVSTVRTEAVKAANSLLSVSGSGGFFALRSAGGEGILTFVAWIVGEYVDGSVSSYHSLDSLIHPKAQSLSPLVICAYLQAIPKMLTSIVSQRLLDWSSENKTMMSLLVARVIHFLEPLAMHPSLEVQERSVELLELMRVASQAVISHGLENDHGPLLLTRAMPQLFTGFELNPVAPSAQRKVPLPNDLDLAAPMNKNLPRLLLLANQGPLAESEAVEFGYFYNKRPIPRVAVGPALGTLPFLGPESSSYQQSGDSIPDSDAYMRKRNERWARNKDDPFYIGKDDLSSGTSTPFHDILRSANGEDVDVDSIPIMKLDLGDKVPTADGSDMGTRRQKRKRHKKFDIAKDENIEHEDPGVAQFGTASVGTTNDNGPLQRAHDKIKKSLLQVDSSVLGSFSLDTFESAAEHLDIERQEAQDAEMTKALAEVERLRLEMQRASERIQATDGTPAEGMLVKKKKKKKLKLKQPAGDLEYQYGNAYPKINDDPIRDSQDTEAVPVMKKKMKQRKPAIAKPDDENGVKSF
ncbi:MAG: AP-3 complex subunit delta [Alectoria sarmentosa]|nr:MAG: AP-3 complex subunit delta [Alectoria sarmentosa]